MDDWLDALAQPSGSPGGGAASGVMVAVAASLMAMVAGYTPDDERMAPCRTRLARHRSEALAAVEADGVASAAFGAALAMADDAPDRDERVRDAAIEAAGSAAGVAEVGLAMLDELHLLADAGNRHVAVDLAVAAEALRAGQSGAALTIRANVQIAQKHGATATNVADLEATTAALADARREVQQVIDELSDRLV